MSYTDIGHNNNNIIVATANQLIEKQCSQLNKQLSMIYTCIDRCSNVETLHVHDVAIYTEHVLWQIHLLIMDNIATVASYLYRNASCTVSCMHWVFSAVSRDLAKHHINWWSCLSIEKLVIMHADIAGVTIWQVSGLNF